MGAKKENKSDPDQVERLEHERDRLLRILDALNDGVIVVDRGAVITFANQAACIMLSWNHDYLGCRLEAVMHCCDGGGTLPFLQSNGSLARSICEGRILSGMEKICGKVKFGLTVDYLVTPLSESGEVVGAAVILNNVSERIMAEGALGEANKRLQRLNVELKRKNKRLQEIAVTDSLTRLYNHRHIIERLQEQVSTAKRYQRELTVIMFDIDFFKKVNDTYGHPFGDKVLEQVAATLREEIRAADIAGRYGGEEFLVVMPETGLAEGLNTAERIRLGLEGLTWRHPITVTISAGVATWQKGETASELITRADALLYKAKEGGRNQVRG